MNKSTNQTISLLFFLKTSKFEIIMIEPRTVAINQECKRPHDHPEQNISSKRLKSDIFDIDEQSDSSTSESKCSSTDTEESNIDQSDDDSNISTDQSRSIPVVLNKTIHQQPTLSRHSKKLIKKFKYLYDHSKRKLIEPTKSIDENLNQTKKLRWELRNTFNRIDLLKEGYAVLSDQSFPFYSLCYMVSNKP